MSSGRSLFSSSANLPAAPRVVSNSAGRPSVDVGLGLGQLGLRHRHVADAAQLLEELDQRAVGLGGLHRRAGAERPGQPLHVERRAGAVGVAVGLAQVLVEPRGEGAAEDGVHHPQRVVVGRRARHADVADLDDGLRRARLVHQVERARAPAPAPRRRARRARRPSPRRRSAPRPARAPRPASRRRRRGAARSPAGRRSRRSARPGRGRAPRSRRRRPARGGRTGVRAVDDGVEGQRRDLAVGWSRSCSSAFLRSSRWRTISESAKAGRSATSAIRSSACGQPRLGARAARGSRVSRPAPAPSDAPR